MSNAAKAFFRNSFVLLFLVTGFLPNFSYGINNIKIIVDAINFCNLSSFESFISEDVSLLSKSYNGESVVLLAIKKKCHKNSIAKVLLKYIKPSQQVNEFGQNILHLAIKYQSEEFVREVLAKNPLLIHGVDSSGMGVVAYAVARQDVRILNLVIKQGGDVNLADKDGMTPFLHAVKNSFNEGAYILIKFGAKANEVDSKGRNALMYAAWSGNVDMVKILLLPNVGMNPNASDFDGNRAIFPPNSCGAGLDVIRPLVKKGALLNYFNSKGESPASHFLGCGNYKELVYILRSRPNLARYGKKDASLLIMTILPFEKGSVNGSSDRVKFTKLLLKNGAIVNDVDEKGNTALIYAVKLNQIKKVRVLLAFSASVNVQNRSGKTAIMYAIENQNPLLVRMLLKAGADVSISDYEGFDALSYGIEGMNEEIIKMLIKEAKDLTSSSRKDENLAFVAAYKNSVSMAKLLLNKKIDFSKVNRSGENAIMAAVKARSHDFLSFFLKSKNFVAPFSWEAKEYSGKNLLMLMIRRGASFEAIRLLLERCHECINNQDSEGSTPLMAAIAARRSAVASYLLQLGADFRSQDSNGFNALMLAAKERMPNIVMGILDRGGDLNAVNGFGQTALMMAIESGDNESAGLLIGSEGVDVHASDINGKTALLMAIKKENEFVVRMLVSHFVFQENRIQIMSSAIRTGNINIIRAMIKSSFEVDFYYESKRLTPLMHFVLQNKIDIVRLILDSNPESLDWQNEKGETALMLAVNHGNIEMVKILMERGSDVGIASKKGKTSAQIAVESQNRKMIKLLKTHSGLLV